MTKRFKALPKSAKRAAFAAMDDEKGRSRASVQMKPKRGQFLHGKDSWTPKRSPERAAKVVKFK